MVKNEHEERKIYDVRGRERMIQDPRRLEKKRKEERVTDRKERRIGEDFVS